MILRQLGQAVRTGRHERRLLVERPFDDAIHRRGCDDEHAARAAGFSHGIKQMVRADDIGLEVGHGVLPRRVDARRSGQVIDVCRPRLLESLSPQPFGRACPRPATSLPRARAAVVGPADATRPQARGQREFVEQMTPGESARTGDESRGHVRYPSKRRRLFACASYP